MRHGKGKALKRIGGVVLALACTVALSLGAIGLVGCSGSGGSGGSSEETWTFTDSLGRQVELPKNLERIWPSGHTAQQVLLTMAPDKMVGLSQPLNDDQLKIFGDKFKDYPVFGAVLGAKDDFNREAVAAAKPQVIIDTGEVKKDTKESLDALQEQLGIPVVFVEAYLEDYGSAYKTLGELLGMEERGNQLSEYCNRVYASGKGSGNEISLEQIAVWNPDLIIFQKGSIYNTVGDDPAWQGISAIANDNYYEVPNNPWCWMNNPPTVNQLMGMQWLPRLLYPNAFDDSIEDVTRDYYKTMYNYDLSDAEMSELLTGALPK